MRIRIRAVIIEDEPLAAQYLMELARREVTAALRRDRRPWVQTVREEFATYYLMRWLGGEPFIQIGRHAVVNLHAIERVTHYGDRLYRVRLRSRRRAEPKRLCGSPTLLDL
jgi:hypothetical protein